jgi:hypothetical protein
MTANVQSDLATYMQSKPKATSFATDNYLKLLHYFPRLNLRTLPLRERVVCPSRPRSSLFPVILRCTPQACLEGRAAGAPGPSPFEARWRSHLRVTANRRAIPMLSPSDLLASTRLAWSAATSHGALRSLRSFAQYSSRFLISRSKPRSGGS